MKAKLQAEVDKCQLGKWHLAKKSSDHSFWWDRYLELTFEGFGALQSKFFRSSFFRFLCLQIKIEFFFFFNKSCPRWWKKFHFHFKLKQVCPGSVPESDKASVKLINLRLLKSTLKHGVGGCGLYDKALLKGTILPETAFLFCNADTVASFFLFSSTIVPNSYAAAC